MAQNDKREGLGENGSIGSGGVESVGVLRLRRVPHSGTAPSLRMTGAGGVDVRAEPGPISEAKINTEILQRSSRMTSKNNYRDPSLRSG